MAKMVSGTVTDPAVDPCGGFGLLLSGDENAGDDDWTADCAAAVDGMPGGGCPVLPWPGTVAKAGDAAGPEARQEATVVEGAGSPWVQGSPPALPVPAATLPPGMATAAQPVLGPTGSGGVSAEALATPNADDQQVSVRTEPVGFASGQSDQAGGRPEVKKGGSRASDARPVRGEAGSDLRATVPYLVIGDANLSLGHGSEIVAAQAGTHPIDPGQAVSVERGAAGLEDGSSGTATGFGAGPVAADRLSPEKPVGRADPLAATPMVAPDLPSEGTMAGRGTLIAAQIPAPVEDAEALPSASEDIGQAAIRIDTGRPPQASFWERLLSGLNDASSSEKAAGETAEPDIDTRPEDRPLDPQGARAGSPPSFASAGIAPIFPGTVNADGSTSEGGTGMQPALAAEPLAPEMARRASAVAPGSAAATSAPSFIADLGPPAAPELRDSVPVPDLLYEGFGDPARLAAPGATPFGLQLGPSPAASPVPMPHLVAQVTTALGSRTEGETELALSPGELGHVRVRLKPDSTNPDRLVVMLTFERPETLDLFRRHAGELADAFRAAGYSGADLGFAQQGSGQPDPGDRRTARGFDGTPPSEPAGDLQPSPRLSHAASLDLRL